MQSKPGSTTKKGSEKNKLKQENKNCLNILKILLLRVYNFINLHKIINK